jgi:hypothetical protein
MIMQMVSSISTQMVSPNPFSDTTVFSLSEESHYHLRIFDISGKQVDESIFFGKEFIYNSAKIPGGVYYYEIRSYSNKNSESSFAKGILIKH